MFKIPNRPHPMKTSLLLLTATAFLAIHALAEAPKPETDFRKTLSAAAKEQKLAFILLGRPTCGNCNATKAMIKDAKIAVTTTDYVMGDLNVDDAKTNAEFMKKYGKENFGNTLPFVVVTDAQGKLLASSGGYKDAGKWNALLAEAKSKAGAKTTGAAAGGKDANWPFSTAKPQ
jgi:thioredoxin-related protein